MLTNKDIRVENGNIVINGDKYPLDGQSPEAIMAIVEDNSDTTPTEDSTAPITSGGVFTALGSKQDTLTFDTTPTGSSDNPVTSDGIKTYVDNLLSDKAVVIKATTSDTKNFTIPVSVWTDAGFTGSNHTALFCGGYYGRVSAGFLGTNGSAVSIVKLGDNTVTATIADGIITLTFNDTVYTDLRLILFN